MSDKLNNHIRISAELEPVFAYGHFFLHLFFFNWDEPTDHELGTISNCCKIFFFLYGDY